MSEISDLTSRRGLLAKAGISGLSVAGLSAALAVTGGLTRTASGQRAPTPDNATDIAVAQFALQLEYLEAEFYLRAIGLPGVPDSGNAPVVGGSEVPFQNPVIRAYAEEIAADELAHVLVLKAILRGNSTPRPAINFTDAFNAAAAAAGLPTPFNPFADEVSFLLGAFIFEDVGVTAYKGAAPLLTDKRLLEAAAGILAVEGYHAANIRTTLVGLAANPMSAFDPIIRATNLISNARDFLDGPGGKDQGLTTQGMLNITPTDRNGIAFSRTTSEVLRIVYLTPELGVSSGGFFPEGVNGTITTT